MSDNEDYVGNSLDCYLKWENKMKLTVFLIYTVGAATGILIGLLVAIWA